VPVQKFGKVQLRIMRVLWEKDRANAREITDALNKGGEIAHSTVQTLLRKLERKGAVAHDQEDRTFIFYPLVKKQEATRAATREFVDRVFSGSAGGLVSYLIENEEISKEELDRIRNLIEEEGQSS
jgi:BlaI family penicillinase repressor